MRDEEGQSIGPAPARRGGGLRAAPCRRVGRVGEAAHPPGRWVAAGQERLESMSIAPMAEIATHVWPREVRVKCTGFLCQGGEAGEEGHPSPRPPVENRRADPIASIVSGSEAVHQGDDVGYEGHQDQDDHQRHGASLVVVPHLLGRGVRVIRKGVSQLYDGRFILSSRTSRPTPHHHPSTTVVPSRAA